MKMITEHHCPRCRALVKLMETNESFWYECSRCGHILSYDEAVEAEKESFNRWARKIAAINEAMQGWD